jgi:hypothetical protein
MFERYLGRYVDLNEKREYLDYLPNEAQDYVLSLLEDKLGGYVYHCASDCLGRLDGQV